MALSHSSRKFFPTSTQSLGDSMVCTSNSHIFLITSQERYHKLSLVMKKKFQILNQREDLIKLQKRTLDHLNHTSLMVTNKNFLLTGFHIYHTVLLLMKCLPLLTELKVVAIPLKFLTCMYIMEIPRES